MSDLVEGTLLGKPVRAGKVFGVVKANVKCNALCTQAKGHSCECSCGGKNHGAGYEAP